MQPYTWAEQLVVTLVIGILTTALLLGFGLRGEWYAWVAGGLLVSLGVAGYTALYNAVVTR